MKKFLIITFFLLSSFISGIAEINDQSIDHFENKVTVRTSIKNSFLQFRIIDPEQEGKDIKYLPNVKTALSALIDYESFAISVSKDFNFRDDEKKGNTEYYDFQLYYFTRNFGCELYYQKYKGYYLDDPEIFDYNPGDSKTTRSDISTFHQGLNLYYIFTDAYSMNAAMNQGEKQNELKGSFMIMGSFNRVKLDSSYSLIPDNQHIYYDEDSNYTGGNYFTFSISPGAGIIIPYEDLFVSFAVFIGYGKAYSENQNIDGQQTGVDNVLKVNMKFSAGYNADNLFYGIVCNYDATNLVANENQFENSFEAGFVEFFLGTRF